MTHTIRKATADDAGRLAGLAAVTFPLACPPQSSPADIAAHVANTLSETTSGTIWRTLGSPFW